MADFVTLHSPTLISRKILRDRKISVISTLCHLNLNKINNDLDGWSDVWNDAKKDTFEEGIHSIRVSELKNSKYATCYYNMLRQNTLKMDKSCKMQKVQAQSGIFRIFLSTRFYVKSILENVEVLKLPFLPFFGLCLQKVQKFLKMRNQSLSMCSNGRFCTSKTSKIGFT